MFRVDVKNRITQEITNSGKFDTLDKANSWINAHHSKGATGIAFGRYYSERDLPKKGMGYQNEVIYDDLLVESEFTNGNETWVHLLPEYETIITDITAEYNDEQDDIAKINVGKISREKCQRVLDYIAGRNISDNLTLEQITTMQTTFADVESALRASRPDLALNAVNNATPDGTIVTQALKDKVILMLS